MEESKANSGIAVNWADAKKRVIHSYRDWLWSVRILPIPQRGYFEADDWFTTNCGVNKRPEAEGRVGFERSGQQ